MTDTTNGSPTTGCCMTETATNWENRQVWCDCGGATVYWRDVEHDGGDCEVFKCLTCGKHIHVELPD